MFAMTRGRSLAASLKSVSIGTSSLGARPGANELARAIVGSPVGQVDTSNNYAGGESERALGRALRERGAISATPFIASKADADPVTGRFDYDQVMRSFEETCQRLGRDHFPLYFLHDPEDVPFAETMGPGGAVEALIRLREEGAVDAIGVATGTVTVVEDYVRTEVFDAVLNHNRWTMVDRSADRLWSLARDRGMAVFNAAPFGGGILAGSAHSGDSYGYRPAPAEVLAYVHRLRQAAGDHQVDLAAAALHWAGADDRVDTVVVGVSSMQRLEQLEALVEAVIPDEFWAALESIGTPPQSVLDR